jgi:hypothetical protein
MRDWLTIELMLTTLLVTTFTSVGLLALWAATSSKHWFLRTVVVIAILSPLLAIPACEPFLVLTLQAGIVAAGVLVWKWRASQKGQIDSRFIENDPNSAMSTTNIRFSLPTVLWLMAIIAIATVIGARIVRSFPALNLAAWLTIAVDAIAAGGFVLVGAWMVAAKRKWLALPIGVVLCILLGLLFAWQDYFVLSTLQLGWPPDVSSWEQMVLASFESASALALRAAMVSVTTAIITTLLICLVSMLYDTSAVTVSQLKRRLFHAASAMCIVTIALFPCFILWKLLNPAPIPRVELPRPNGYADLSAAGATVQARSAILNTMIEPKSTAELSAEVAKFKPTFNRIRLGLSRSCMVPLWPADGKFDEGENDLSLNDIQNIRSVARALMREADLAGQENRPEDAAFSALDNLKMGHACARGGLFVHLLAGAAVEGIGQQSLYRALPNVGDETSERLLTAIDQLDQNREPLTEIIDRERIWAENAYGWFGHLQAVLYECVDGEYKPASYIQDTILRRQALARMMMTELALRRYVTANKSLPEKLGNLVPRFLKRVPIDPFDPKGGELRYRRTPEGYLLYSLGNDRDDDAGKDPQSDESGSIDWHADGDLPIRDYFADLEEVERQTRAADASADSEE